MPLTGTVWNPSSSFLGSSFNGTGELDRTEVCAATVRAATAGVGAVEAVSPPPPACLASILALHPPPPPAVAIGGLYLAAAGTGLSERAVGTGAPASVRLQVESSFFTGVGAMTDFR